MKITPHKTVTQSTCLPPEAHIHLWDSVAKTATPKFKSTVYHKRLAFDMAYKKLNGDDFNKFQGIK
jgi:hypothetical protein